jgi:sialidase-1
MATAASAQLRQQDIFVCGESGYHTYRIPALVVATNGTLLAFCEGRKNSASDAGDIDILLKSSSNGGQTWSASQVLWDDGANTCGNPCPVVDETTGVVWLLLTHNPGDMNEQQITRKDSGARTVWLSRSEDNGQTWAAPVNVTESVKDPAWGWYATGPGIGIQIRQGPHQGRLVIPCDHSSPERTNTAGSLPSGAASHVIYSDDHGRTWNIGGSVEPNLNECQVVELADGRGTLLLNVRNYARENHRSQSLSADGGITWSAPEYQAQLVEPRCQASILRYNWPDASGPGHILFSNPASTHRQNLTIRVSRDEAKTWAYSKTLHAGPSAYSCLAVLPDRTIGCLYECGNTNAYEKITFARFPISWVEGNF